MQWLTTADFADALPKLDIEKARHPERLSEAEFVKDNTVRTVMRVAHPSAPDGRRLYIKRFKFKNLRRKLRHLVMPTQAEHEWRIGRALQRDGIPTCRVLAMACRKGVVFHQEAFLVSEEIRETVPLALHFASPGPEPLQPGDRKQLIEELAALVVRLIGAGYYHCDLHAGNVLIAPHRPVGERLFVLDLHSIRSGRPTRRRVLRMLAFLADSSQRSGTGNTDRVRFLRALVKGRAEAGRPAPGTLRDWAMWAKAAWEQHRRRHVRSRTRRCLLESKEFTRDRAPGYRVMRRREFPLEEALATARAHEEAIAGRAGCCEIRKKGPRTEVTICPCRTAGAVCVKAFLRSGFSERLKDLFRPRSRARAAWIAHRGLRVRGLPAARGLALLEAGAKLSGRPDYLIMEALEVDGNLQEMACTRLAGSQQSDRPLLTAEQRRELILAVADLFRLMAEKQVEHPDMKPSNILVATDAGRVRLWLVDLDRLRFEERWERKQWVQHLAKCDAGLPAQVTLLERMRCLRECGRGRWTPAQRGEIARAVRECSLMRNPAWGSGWPGGHLSDA